MGQFLFFIIIFGIMMFIWSFVYLNRSGDKINESFLGMLSLIMTWMVLSENQNFSDNSIGFIILNTIYWFCMLNLSIAFLLFVYRLLNKKLDVIYILTVVINELTILSRFLFPIDYSELAFWRLTDPVIAPIMSGIFSLPALLGLALLLRQSRITEDSRQKRQLMTIGIGISLALLISVISEYILPTIFDIDMHLSLMYVAVLIFSIFAFVVIMKHRLLNLQADYIYNKLLINAMDGIIIINKNNRIIYINVLAKDILKCEKIEIGDKLTDYIRDYDFTANYKQHEVTIKSEVHEGYFMITQFPIDDSYYGPAKLMTLTDITTAKLKLKREKEILLEKSSIDQLTGLFNKQYCMDAYGKECSEASEAKLTIMFIDVDDFKSINDIYGHIVGDLVLKSIAVNIKDAIGKRAMVSRFGGDEFLVIFQNTSMNEAYEKAEEIRRKVYEIDLSEYNEKLKISLSIGLTEGKPPLMNLIMKADTAMYASKSDGKNRTTIL